MHTIAPFYKVFSWSPTVGAIWAIILGFFFGFSLERAGFGNARVLAGVWYGYDFAVIRVMFTAIIVSAIGLFGLHAMGILDLDLVYINKTYLWPQIVGGFIFGIGFNIGQYCPGTSAVACATGKLDGVVFVLGFLVGVAVFAYSFPAIEGFFNSSYKGRLTLDAVFGISAGVLVFFVALIGVGAFVLTHYLDKKFGNSEERRAA